MFYHYSQNNSRGTFDFDKDAGITHHVIVEADSIDEANIRAEKIGLYWDGCSNGADCPCCGDRWYSKSSPYDDEEGSDVPLVYGENPEEYEDLLFKKGESIAIHFKDGIIKWY